MQKSIPQKVPADLIFIQMTFNSPANIYTRIIRANPLQVCLMNKTIPKDYRLAKLIPEKDTVELNTRSRRVVSYKPRKDYVLLDGDELIDTDEEGSPTRYDVKKTEINTITEPVIEDNDIEKIDNNDEYEVCRYIIAQLKAHPSAQLFLQKNEYTPNSGSPTNLNEVEEKLQLGEYDSCYHFALDIRNLWNISWFNNTVGSSEYLATTQISNFFEALVKETGKKKFWKYKRPVKSVDNFKSPLKQVHTPSKKKFKKMLPMSDSEKKSLKKCLISLSQDKLIALVPILKPYIDFDPKNLLEFEVEALPYAACRQLEVFIRRNGWNTQESTAKALRSKKSHKKKIIGSKISPVKSTFTQPISEDSDSKELIPGSKRSFFAHEKEKVVIVNKDPSPFRESESESEFESDSEERENQSNTSFFKEKNKTKNVSETKVEGGVEGLYVLQNIIEDEPSPKRSLAKL